MAEVTAFRNNATSYPIYGCPYTVVFPIFDTDSIVTGAATPDSEISKNGDTYADCTNEFTEIATSSGTYYLTLTATELTCDAASVIAKSATAGTIVTQLVLQPEKLATVWSGTAASAGSITSTIILNSTASVIDDYYNGMICVATIDTLIEVRIISDYVGSTKTASVVPDWNVAPDSDDTFVIKLPRGGTMGAVTSVNAIGPTVSGTSDSGSTTTMVDAARTEADTNYWVGSLLVFTSGTIAGQARIISGFAPGTDTITFSPATTQAVSTQTYEIWP